jgi:ribonuclease D
MTVLLIDRDYPEEWYQAAKAAKIVGMDIETSGLNKERDRVATVQMYVPNMGTIMVRNMEQPMVLLRLLEDKTIRKVFHHAPFDLSFLMRDHIVYPESIADTKIAARFIDPKRTRFIDPITNRGSHSLRALVFYYYKEVLDKTLAISDWFAPLLSSEQVTYAAKDVEFLPEMLQIMEKEISAMRQIKAARKLMNGVPTYVMMQMGKYSGIYEW